MLELLNTSILLRALVASLAVALTSTMLGTFLVAKRYSMITDSLAHVSLAGVALGLLLGINPVLTATLSAILATILVDRLRQKHGVSGETVLSIFMTGGLALAVVLMSLRPGLTEDELSSYLTGSINTISSFDLWLMLGLTALTLVAIKIFYKELLYICFDEEGAQVSGVPVTKINFLLMILTALTVSVASKIMGALLIGAVMVIPTVTARLWHKGFRRTVVISVGYSLINVLIGVVVAFYLDLPTGGSVVLCLLSSFLLTLAARKVRAFGTK